jgi:SAM-dependent methyltransferase
MWSDVVDFNRFYRDRLGQVAQRLVEAEIRAHWPNMTAQTVVGIGYATPFLSRIDEEAGRCLAIMPAHQGVTHWPREGLNKTALAEETALPFDDQSVDRLLLVHAVENAEHLRAMMQECWRVLNGHGRILAVVPARRGLWSRVERTPFGHGKPFSQAQMERLLKDTLLEPMSITRALYMPPITWEPVLRAGATFERIGKRWFPRIGGVLVVEARKQIYAAAPARKLVFKPRLMPVPSLNPAPAGRMGGSASPNLADLSS